MARRLGLDPGSLIADDESPRFLWRDEARFKNLTSEDSLERAGIASFGRAVATAIASVTTSPPPTPNERSAGELRDLLLSGGRPYVGLGDLLALSWGVGIPVVQLRVFPWPAKRMAAMTVRVGQRSVILLAKDAVYPAWTSFYLAHELGHLALAHLEAGQSLVDLDPDEGSRPGVGDGDVEEADADSWALELLTGLPRPEVLSKTGAASATELARVTQEAGPQLGIEPGTLALLFAHTTNRWATANAALTKIYAQPSPVWRAVNGYAMGQLQLSQNPDTDAFLSDVLELAELRRADS